MITARIERDQPTLRGHVQSMCSFVAAYSGGAKPIYLNDLEAFSRTLNAYRRNVSGITFKLLAAVSLAQAPEWVISCVKAHLVAPD
eukprot:3183982-Pyramimonas_sp.AAC.1